MRPWSRQDVAVGAGTVLLGGVILSNINFDQNCCVHLPYLSTLLVPLETKSMGIGHGPPLVTIVAGASRR